MTVLQKLCPVLFASGILLAMPNSTHAQLGGFLKDIVDDTVEQALPEALQSGQQQTASTPFADKINSSNGNYEKTVVQGAAVGGTIGFIGCQLADCDATTTAGVTLLSTLIGAGVGDYVAKRNAEYATLQEAAQQELEYAKTRRAEAQNTINTANELIAYYEVALPKYRTQLAQRRITKVQYDANIADLLASKQSFAALIEMENVNLAILEDIRDDIAESSDQSDDIYYAALDEEIRSTNMRIAEEQTIDNTLSTLVDSAES